MAARVDTVAFHGIEVQNVNVGMQISSGLTTLTIVEHNKRIAKILLLCFLTLPLTSCAFPYVLASLDPAPYLEYHGDLAQAEKGDPDAQFEVAEALNNACDMRRGLNWKPECDERACSHWYHLAAGNGVVEAQQELGRMYRLGYCGVEKDINEGIKWYRRAADQGYVPAYIELAKIYDKGWGVSQDKPEAVKWYQKAAEAGSQYAQKMLEPEQNDVSKKDSHGRPR